ncbi:MAG TPA: glycolate oxidase subunit GlcE [Hyphomonadaceae bacterium]|jgi:glycolate oxidase FAD binding subunit|nr:glycolate oxidase subunit GlcE [Hyphomonadaceae bacterium]
MLQPADEQEIREIVSQHAASGSALEIVGGGTKQGIGRPRETTRLSTSRLNRVINYDPAELILTVEPGAKLSEIEALLAQHNQMLAFDPWDFAETAGGEPNRSTIGGVIGSGFAGPRRISAGSVRDHMLGFHAINGRGEAFKAGGNVVKNVTGYDLPKLMAASWGQLCVLTQVTLKVLPRPPESRTLALRGLSHAAAVDAMSRAMRAPADVAAACHIPAQTSEPSITAIRLEGFGPSIEARARLLTGLLADAGKLEPMQTSEAGTHWLCIRAGNLPQSHQLPLLWRIIVPPAAGADALDGIERFGGIGMLDWAGGLIWARTVAEAAVSIREVADLSGGHAMLVSAPEEVQRDIPAQHPEQPGVAALSHRVRAAFDPSGVFDPHRFDAHRARAPA